MILKTSGDWWICEDTRQSQTLLVEDEDLGVTYLKFKLQTFVSLWELIYLMLIVGNLSSLLYAG